MNEILINIISVIVTAVVIPVITLVGGKLVSSYYACAILSDEG